MSDPPKVVDSSTGISLRFVREFDAEKDRSPSYIDLVLLSCRWLDHVWEQDDETNAHCQICGLLRTHVPG